MVSNLPYQPGNPEVPFFIPLSSVLGYPESRLTRCLHLYFHYYQLLKRNTPPRYSLNDQ